MKRYLFTLVVATFISYAYADDVKDTAAVVDTAAADENKTLPMVVLPPNVDDDNQEPHRFDWNAYVSQTFVSQQDTNRVTPSATSRNEIGAFATFALSPAVSLRGMISRIGENDKDFRINYALADVHLWSPNRFTEVGVRVGRVPNVLGFYNEGRNNPASRSYEFPPQGIYQDRFRYLTRSADGVQLYSDINYGGWSFSLEAAHGSPYLYPKDDVVETVYLINATEFNSHSRISAFSVGAHYEPTGTCLHYNLNQLDFQSSTGIVVGQTQSTAHYFGIQQYVSEKSQVKLEYMWIDTVGDGFKKATGRDSSMSVAQSINYSYQFNPSWLAQIGYDVFYIDPNDKYGDIRAAQSGLTSPRYYHESLNLGIKYRVGNWAVKAETHKVRGTYALSIADNYSFTSMKPEWSYSAITVTYMFK